MTYSTRNQYFLVILQTYFVIVTIRNKNNKE